MAVSLSNRKRIKKRKAPSTKKNATATPNKRPLAPVRQRRGGRYADTTSRMNTGDGGMALLNAVRSQGKLEALHDQSRKTIGHLEMRLGKAEATLRHKLDGHRAERDGDINMHEAPPTVPLRGDDDDHSPPQQGAPAPAKPDVDMQGAVPMSSPDPMGGTASPNPGAKQQPTRRITHPKLSMDVDSISPSDFIQKRPSSSSLTQPTSRRTRIGDDNENANNQQLALSVARAKPDRDRENYDEAHGNKKQRSVGFGTQQASAITDTNKKMRAQPGGVSDPLALPPSTTGIGESTAPATQLSRKQHATTANQFAQIADDGEAAGGGMMT